VLTSLDFKGVSNYLVQNLPWVILYVLPGLFNFISSYSIFRREIKRRLIFCKYYLYKSFQFWCLLVFLVPPVLFHWLFSINWQSTKLDLTIYFKAASFGLIFASFLQSTPAVGAYDFNLKDVYFSLQWLFLQHIIDSENGYHTEFWDTLQEDLASAFTKQASFLYDGLRFLNNFLDQRRSSFLAFRQSGQDENDALILKIQDMSSLQVNQFDAATAQAEAAKVIFILKQIAIEKKDYPRILREFGCQNTITVFFNPHNPR
jgi:hypothetical protein